MWSDPQGPVPSGPRAPDSLSLSTPLSLLFSQRQPCRSPSGFLTPSSRLLHTWFSPPGPFFLPFQARSQLPNFSWFSLGGSLMYRIGLIIAFVPSHTLTARPCMTYFHTVIFFNGVSTCRPTTPNESQALPFCLASLHLWSQASQIWCPLCPFCLVYILKG